jgi:hypothetical protein
VHLRVMIAAVIGFTTLAGCAESVKGVVLEKYDARNGVPQTFGCLTTEWLLVIDQGERIKSRERFKKICVTYTKATGYDIGDKYP